MVTSRNCTFIENRTVRSILTVMNLRLVVMKLVIDRNVSMTFIDNDVMK